MSASTLAVEARRTGLVVRVRDYVELTKPKIAVLVLITVAVAAVVASWGLPDPWVLMHALIGTLLVASSASALNQWLEIDRDQMMERTASRPLPAGRLFSSEVLLFAVLTIVTGMFYLAWFVNWSAALWGFATWFMYVWVYTPLKLRSPTNTAVGAVAGALPMLIGWSATGTALDARAAALFMIVFLWQFPHFMAIAWIYRKQYASAGMKMLPVVDPSGHRAGVQAVLCAAALLPVSLIPVMFTSGVAWYLVLAVLLGLAQLACAVAFYRERTERTARWLLRASLIYLPILLVLLVLAPIL